MKVIISFFLTFLTFSAINGQPAVVQQKLDALGIDQSAFETAFHDASAKYYFKLETKSKNDSDGYESDDVTEFDPSRPVGEKWALLLRQGKEPSDKDKSTYKKAYNTKTDEVDAKVNTATWAVLEETDDLLKIKFNYNPKSLPKKYSYLATLDGVATINKANKTLETLVFKSEKPVKKGIIKIESLDLEIEMMKDDAGNYLIKQESSRMTIKVLGQVVSANETETYTDYKKIQ